MRMKISFSIRWNLIPYTQLTSECYMNWITEWVSRSGLEERKQKKKKWKRKSDTKWYWNCVSSVATTVRKILSFICMRMDVNTNKNVQQYCPMESWLASTNTEYIISNLWRIFVCKFAIQNFRLFPFQNHY